MPGASATGMPTTLSILLWRCSAIVAAGDIREYAFQYSFGDAQAGVL